MGRAAHGDGVCRAAVADRRPGRTGSIGRAHGAAAAQRCLRRRHDTEAAGRSPDSACF